MRNLAIIENGAVAVADGAVVAIGSSDKILSTYLAASKIDAEGRVVCPGFVDAHTHVVYAGERIDEFEMRVSGVSYMDIMASGGGIAATTRATRAVSAEQLAAQTEMRLNTMLSLGTTTAEVKSGYGLNIETELKMLQVTASLHDKHAIDLVPTFMAAHAVPGEYAENPEAYVGHIVRDMFPHIAAWYQSSSFQKQNIPLFNDVFCEQNAFDVTQSHRVLSTGKDWGMRVKAHVDEFSSLGGVQMALALGAISIDHLDVTTTEDIELIAGSDTVAVVIPAVNFNLGSSQFADARAMIDAGAALALSTDINPGSSPCASMPLVMAIACRYQAVTPAEALTASTINAAHAIGMGHRVGSLESGKLADLLILNVSDYRRLAYEFGSNQVARVLKKGRVVYDHTI